jgi:ABC-type multidrug transport system fused ATPase/permease subunit
MWILDCSEKDAKLAQKLDQLQPFVAVFPQEYMGQLASSGPASNTFLDCDRQSQETGQLSGGWRMKLALSRAMLMNADIMLMDEPTNHLDVSNVAWVKEYLNGLKLVTCIMVITRPAHGSHGPPCHIVALPPLPELSPLMGTQRRVVISGRLTMRLGQP